MYNKKNSAKKVQSYSKLSFVLMCRINCKLCQLDNTSNLFVKLQIKYKLIIKIVAWDSNQLDRQSDFLPPASTFGLASGRLNVTRKNERVNYKKKLFPTKCWSIWLLTILSLRHSLANWRATAVALATILERNVCPKY